MGNCSRVGGRLINLDVIVNVYHYDYSSATNSLMFGVDSVLPPLKKSQLNYV